MKDELYSVMRSNEARDGSPDARHVWVIEAPGGYYLSIRRSSEDEKKLVWRRNINAALQFDEDAGVTTPEEFLEAMRVASPGLFMFEYVLEPASVQLIGVGSKSKGD